MAFSACRKAVQLGVGAAFSFITGKVRQAPKWMQKTGLEWLYRMPQEPGKTMYRMLLVPEFLLRTLSQVIRAK
jgi:N-acetylglucosaminyldiphosphoundecaprenol N-acetyl-beta-D-mannosaminyltransferase